MVVEIQMDMKLDALKKLRKGDIFEKVRNELMEKAKRDCIEKYVPVDTGKLRDSVFVLPVKDGFILGAGNDEVKYAIFNEYGSYITPAGSMEHPLPANKKGYRPFIRPTLYGIMKEHPKLFGRKWYKLMTG
jgi:hypothetical protein